MRSGFILNGRIARLPKIFRHENCDDDSEKESFGAPVRRNRSCGLDIENEGGGARVTVFDAADRPPALFAAWQPMRILLIENDPVVCAEHHANA